MIPLNSELRGKTLGIVGFGVIGRRVAKLSNAFGMKILTYDPYISSEVLHELAAESVSLERLLKESDVITIHVARTKETFHMISENEFRMMKKSAILVNCSRGDIVDEESLLSALGENSISGAGLDVLETEPPSLGSSLFKFPNLIITPHVAGFTKEVRQNSMVALAQDIDRALKGQMPINLVNKEILDRQK
jgi:D-3-phosphoglycerate dehydrogenase